MDLQAAGCPPSTSAITTCVKCYQPLSVLEVKMIRDCEILTKQGIIVSLNHFSQVCPYADNIY